MNIKAQKSKIHIFISLIEFRSLVEIKFFYLSTCIVWYLGWGFHIMPHQYIWSYCIFEIWLDSWSSRCFECSINYFVYRYNINICSTLCNKYFIYIMQIISYFSVCIALVTVLSAIGICERCRVESGGIYFLLSHVLGSRFGGSIGLLYCFGQVKKN